MDIKVNEQTQRFYLAFEKWTPAVGHEIKIGNLRLCAVPLNGKINISEITTGAKIIEIPIDNKFMIQTATKEGAMEFFYKLGESLERLVTKSDIEGQLDNVKQIQISRLGKKPPTENVDTDWIFAEEGNLKH